MSSISRASHFRADHLLVHPFASYFLADHIILHPSIPLASYFLPSSENFFRDANGLKTAVKSEILYKICHVRLVNIFKDSRHFCSCSIGGSENNLKTKKVPFTSFSYNGAVH